MNWNYPSKRLSIFVNISKIDVSDSPANVPLKLGSVLVIALYYCDLQPIAKPEGQKDVNANCRRWHENT